MPADAATSRRAQAVGMVVELKKGEGLFLGRSFIVNQEGRSTRLYVEGTVPVLRERHAIRAESADSAPKRLYLTIQRMYLEDQTSHLCELYSNEAKQVAETIPNSRSILDDIEEFIATKSLYKALKEARRLVDGF
jgi:flagellar protein FlbT